MLLAKRWSGISAGHIYPALFLAICTALATSLFVDAWPRKVMYFTSYAAIIFMAVAIKRKTFVYDGSALAVAGALLFLGAVRFTWGTLFAHAQYSDVVSNYRLGGKLFMISALLAYFMIAWRHCVTQNLAIKAFGVLLVGLLATLGFALHEHATTGLRVQLLTDSAGTVSYLMTALALSCLFMGYRAITHTGVRMGIFLGIFVLNTLLLILTESRAGVLTLPVLYLAFFCVSHTQLIKYALIPLVVAMAVGFALMPQSVWQRLESIRAEVDTYHTNNDTSIGARFSIWKGGYASIHWSLLGQSPDDRTEKARAFIQQHERGNPEAYKNVKYHLHDDVLETLSLQGIAGGVSILVFYGVLVIVPVRRRSSAIAVLPISLIVFGLTDTVLIQSQSVTMLCLALFASYALMTPASRHAGVPLR